jgi:hypothetical protein
MSPRTTPDATRTRRNAQSARNRDLGGFDGVRAEVGPGGVTSRRGDAVGHAEKLIHGYARHFNTHRPHQGRNQLVRLNGPNVIPLPTARIKRRQAVTGLINEYHREELRIRRNFRLRPVKPF